MPTPARRLLLLALTLLLSAAIAIPVAAGARPAPASSAKAAKAKKCRKGFVRNKRHRCVRRHKAKPKVVRTPATTTLLPGSQATLDFGGGNVRTVALSGTVRGVIPTAIHINSDTTVDLTRGQITPAPTDIFTDDCASPALAASDPASVIVLDPAKRSTATLHASGAVTATTNVIIRIALDERQACGQPPFTTGYTDNPVSVPLAGHVVPATGLSNLELDSPAYPLTLAGCTTAGSPTTPCAGTPTTYDTTATVKLFVRIGIGA
jgi:hypothetical protein